MYNKGGVIEFKIKHRYIQNFHILKNMFVNIILVVVFSNFLISLFFSNIKITIYQCYNVDLKQISSFSIIAEMSKASELSALSVDGTFNFGKFEVTPFTYRHPNIECKSKNIPEASHNNCSNPYTSIQKAGNLRKRFFQAVARKCTFENDELSIITR